MQKNDEQGNPVDYSLISILVHELIGLGCSYFQKNKTPLGEEKINKIVKEIVSRVWGEDSEEDFVRDSDLIISALTEKEIKDFYSLLKHQKGEK